MKAKQKRIIVSVTNDLVTDNRVHKVCTSLCNMGFQVLLIGRKLSSSPEIKRNYSTKRFRLWFNKRAFFYAEYNIRLFVYLLFVKADIFLANDLDTLSANFLAAKIRSKDLVYDSHEYFTEVPELIKRPNVKKIWEWLERKIVPNIKFTYTVCQSIANIYKEKYGVDFKVVRNIPRSSDIRFKKRKKPTKTILYQGALNINRGLQQAILAMHFIKNAKLQLIGDGDICEELKALVQAEKLSNKVEFIGRIPINELANYTRNADLGLSIEEDMGLNYRFALPNKLFDYIHAEVPVVVSNLPEMKELVEQYKIGEIADSLEPQKLATLINSALNDTEKHQIWEKNLKIARKELTWENEEIVLQSIFSNFLN